MPMKGSVEATIARPATMVQATGRHWPRTSHQQREDAHRRPKSQRGGQRDAARRAGRASAR